MVTKRLLSILACAILGACSSLTTSPPAGETAPPAVTGLLILEDRSLQVAPAELDYTGKAVWQSPQGWKYSGEMVDGQPHGQGTKTGDGERYTGQWQSGQRHGQGEFEDAGGGRYRGAWLADQRHGYGIQRYPDGTIYEGDWRQGVRAGFGIETDHRSSVYEGSWANDAREGYGTMRYANQVVYTGMWHMGKRHGYGEETRPDLSVYKGDWAEGQRHGQGIETYADGSRHEGRWESDRILGPGTRTNRAGIEFSGAWTTDVMSFGLVTLPDGPQFAGALFTERGKAVAPGFLAWLQQQSSPWAAYFLGAAYLDFTDPAPDPATAATWLQRAADAGVAEAQYRLALIERELDPRHTVALLHKASASGHGSAAALLGEFYHIGLFVEQNLQRAVALYQQAAERGNLKAINNLAWLLATTVSELADPQRAVALIQPLVVYLGNWQHLDTLAAAHARLGNLALAQQLQHQALITARERALLQEADPSSNLSDTIAAMETRLSTYQANRAYTE